MWVHTINMSLPITSTSNMWPEYDLMHWDYIAGDVIHCRWLIFMLPSLLSRLHAWHALDCVHWVYPSRHEHWRGFDLMMGHNLRRWPNIKPKYYVSAGVWALGNTPPPPPYKWISLQAYHQHVIIWYYVYDLNVVFQYVFLNNAVKLILLFYLHRSDGHHWGGTVQWTR